MPHQRRHDSVPDSVNLLVRENHRERVVASALDSRLLAGARLGAAAESPLAMDDACSGWKKTDPQKGRLIEMRYFGGMATQESAVALSIPVHVCAP